MFVEIRPICLERNGFLRYCSKMGQDGAYNLARMDKASLIGGREQEGLVN